MMQKVHFRLTAVAQKRCCLSSLYMTTDPNLHELCPSVSLGPKEERYWDPVQRVILNRATYPFLGANTVPTEAGT